MLTILLRRLRRDPLTSAVNLAGLAVGIAACLFVALYLRWETSYDRFLPDADRLYRLSNTLTANGAPRTLPSTPPWVAGALAGSAPEVAAVTRTQRQAMGLRRPDSADAAGQETALLVDATFFDVFALPLLRGNRVDALKAPNAVVLTESAARRLFGDADPLGQSVLADAPGSDVPRALTVTGVIADLPDNSHFSFTALVAEAGRPDAWDAPTPLLPTPPLPTAGRPGAGTVVTTTNVRSVQAAATYVKLAPGATADALRARFDDLVANHGRGASGVEAAVFQAMRPNLDLHRVTDIHLHHTLRGDAKTGGDPATLRILAGVGALILVIAAINATNLLTAQALARGREVGIHKVLGAQRGRLVRRFLGESMLLAGIATLLALVLVELLRPAFNGLVERDLALGQLPLVEVVLFLLAVPVIVGALGGLYPAPLLAGWRPDDIFRGKGGPAGSSRLRGGLVVVQFAAAIGLVAVTVTVFSQVSLLRTANPGFDQENLVVASIPLQPSSLRSAEGPAGLQAILNPGRRDALKAELLRHPDIQGVAFSQVVPAGQTAVVNTVRVVGIGDRTTGAELPLTSYTVDSDFFDIYRVRFLAGGPPPPPPALPVDDPDAMLRAFMGDGGPRQVVLNEAALRQLGITDPQSVIGTNPFPASGPQLTVVGVIADMRLRSARETVEPAMYVTGAGRLTEVSIRLAPGHPKAALDHIDAVFAQFHPGQTVRRDFLDDRIAALYRNEERQARVFAVFAGMAVLLANLGLFGLAALAAAKRTREIGIRRVVGATVTDIVRLLTWQFTRPVLMANLIAWPVAWVLLARWLEGYALRIDLGPLPFLVAGASALALAVGTVAVHAVRVAAAPPALALRTE